MKIRAGHSKLVTLGLLLFCMCLSANLAYGMGGGGSNGDGRWDFARPTGASTGNSGTPDFRQDRAGGSWSGGADVQCVIVPPAGDAGLVAGTCRGAASGLWHNWARNCEKKIQ